eukprot:2540496-Alexandrium_andersonii.AAC.1
MAEAGRNAGRHPGGGTPETRRRAHRDTAAAERPVAGRVGAELRPDERPERREVRRLSLIHISEPTRLALI